jgi:hypothetical protein
VASGSAADAGEPASDVSAVAADAAAAPLNT